VIRDHLPRRNANPTPKGCYIPALIEIFHYEYRRGYSIEQD